MIPIRHEEIQPKHDVVDNTVSTTSSSAILSNEVWNYPSKELSANSSATASLGASANIDRMAANKPDIGTSPRGDRNNADSAAPAFAKEVNAAAQANTALAKAAGDHNHVELTRPGAGWTPTYSPNESIVIPRLIPHTDHKTGITTYSLQYERRTAFPDGHGGYTVDGRPVNVPKSATPQVIHTSRGTFIPSYPPGSYNMHGRTYPGRR